jgi:hypothetical protein
LAPVAGDVADNDTQPAILEREHVIEIATRARAVGGVVGDRCCHRTEPGGRDGKQCGLQQPHVLEQLNTLAIEAT